MNPFLVWLLFTTTAVTLDPNASNMATLLPAADGRATAIYVEGKAGRQEVTQPYQRAVVSKEGAVSLEQVTEKVVRADHPELFALAPKAESRYVLQFNAGSTTLTPDSQAKVAEVLRDVKAREGGEAVVVGHTDRVGNPADNDALSLSRAKVIRQLLLDAGMGAELVLSLIHI